MNRESEFALTTMKVIPDESEPFVSISVSAIGGGMASFYLRVTPEELRSLADQLELQLTKKEDAA